MAAPGQTSGSVKKKKSPDDYSRIPPQPFIALLPGSSLPIRRWDGKNCLSTWRFTDTEGLGREEEDKKQEKFKKKREHL